MQKTGRLNRNGIAILRNTDGYNPTTNARPGYTEGRTIRQNLRVTGKLIEQGVRYGTNPLTPRYKSVKAGR